MSRTTVTGYTKNPCTPDNMAIDQFGSYLITKNGNYVNVPVGWSIKEIQLSSVGATIEEPSPGTNIIVYLGVPAEPDIDLMTAPASLLNSNGTVTMIGTDNSATQIVLTDPKFLMVKTDTGPLSISSVLRVTVKLQLMDYQVPDQGNQYEIPNN